MHPFLLKTISKFLVIVLISANSFAASVDIGAGGIPTSEKGAANGVAPLDASSKVPFANLPAIGGGTVSDVSIVSANGLAGSVANSTTTPAITLSTSVTGMVKGNGTSFSAAVAGTDYEAALAAGTNLQYYRGDKTWQTLNTTAVPEGTNLYYTTARARGDAVADAIVDAVTNVAPSQNAVYDALAGKFTLPALTSGSVLFSDGSTIAQDNTNFYFDDASNILKLRNSKYQFGYTDPFARPALWAYETNQALLLGSWGADGLPSNVNSEGIIVYGDEALTSTAIAQTHGSYARIKAGRFGLFSVESTLPAYSGGQYWFRVDPTSLYLRDNSGTKTFEVTRSSGQIDTSLGAGVVQSNASGILSSAALAGSQVTNTPAGNIAATDVQTAINELDTEKQASLGFTPENVVNKDTDGTLAANSDTKYPSQKAVKTYADTKASSIVPANSEMVWVNSLLGSNVTGTGAYDKPWATVAYAMTQITDSSINKPYAIMLQANRQVETSDVAMKPYTFIVGSMQRASYIRAPGFAIKPDASWGTSSAWAGLSNVYVGGGTAMTFDLQALGGSNSTIVLQDTTFSGPITIKGRNAGGGDFLEMYNSLLLSTLTLDSINLQIQSTELGGAVAITDTQATSATGTVEFSTVDTSLSTAESLQMYGINYASGATFTSVGTVTISSYDGLPNKSVRTLSGGTTLNNLKNASTAYYPPTTAGDWNSAPSDVLGALDSLASSGIVKSQNQNLVFASPNGSSGIPAFRAIVAADIPTLNQNTTGNAATATALAANPTDCAAGTKATAIDAQGNLTCSAVVQNTDAKASVIDGGNAAYSIARTDDHVRSSTTLTANRTYTLPACDASHIGERHSVKNLPAQTFNIILAASGSDDIDGNANHTITPGSALSVVCAAFSSAGTWDIQ